MIDRQGKVWLLDMGASKEVGDGQTAPNLSQSTHMVVRNGFSPLEQYTDSGIILDFTVNEQPGGVFTCDNVGYIPIYTWKQNGAVKVLPSGRYLENRPTGMDDENYNRMVASYYEIVEVMGNQFQLING